MALQYTYTLGPLTWADVSEAHAASQMAWVAPPGAAGFIDLRGVPACGEAGTTNERQVVLCWWAVGATIPDTHAVLNTTAGDIRDIQSTTSMRNLFNTLTGIRPDDLTGKLAGLLLDLFTNASNPDADDCVPTCTKHICDLRIPMPNVPGHWIGKYVPPTK